MVLALRSILRVGCLIVALGVFVFDYKLTANNNANTTNFFRMEADRPRDEEEHATTTPSCQKKDSFRSPHDVIINRSHLITPLSGCHMAKWIYVYPIQRHLQNRALYPHNIDNPPRMTTQRLHSADCLEERPFKRLPADPAVANHHLGKWGDTVYVPFTRVEHFVTNLLPGINKPIVVLSGQWYLVNALKDGTIQRLLDHSSVVAWFCQNLDVYAANFTRHPKVFPFPYGSFDAPFRHLYTKRLQFLEYATAARQQQRTTVVGLHLGYFGGTSADRAGIPKGPKKQPTMEYYESLASSRYIFSPNGDRPECYRHFEAIGLGAIAITQMNPWTYRHLTGSVIFNNSDWNVTRWNTTTTTAMLLTEDDGAVVPKAPIRDMIYQDYWKGYVEQQVNQTLSWDDDWTEVMSFVEK